MSLLESLIDSLNESFQYANSLVGNDGTMIKTNGGFIDIQHKNTKYSPRKQSIVNFVVDKDKRGQGIGDSLVKHALTQYDDLGGQVSSLASLKVLHNNGFRSPSMPNGTYQQHVDEFNNDGSIYMAVNNSEGKPYVGDK
jgi:ribosomal protein S18 acetylase RimI-like enzyme